LSEARLNLYCGMKNFFKKQREIITILIYVGVVLVLIYFVILPLLSKIKNINDQIQEGGMKQELVKQQLAELPKIQQQYNVLQKNEGLIDVLLNEEEAVVLIERLEKLAQDSGNKIEISVQNPQLKKSTATVPGKINADNVLVSALPSTDYLQMQILLTGDYNKAVDFIGKLENIEYYSDIIGIRIKQGELSSSTGAANPFIPGSVVDPQQISNGSNLADLKTILDVVFYTKK